MAKYIVENWHKGVSDEAKPTRQAESSGLPKRELL